MAAIIFFLELSVLLVLFKGVLGFEFRTAPAALAAGAWGAGVHLLIVQVFPEIYLTLYYLGIGISAVIMPLIFRSTPVAVLIISLCVMQLFSLLDTLCIGVWVLRCEGNIMQVNLDVSFIIGIGLILVSVCALSVLLREKTGLIHEHVKRLNPVVFIPCLISIAVLNYAPYYVGETSSSLPEIIYGKNMIKNGIMAILVTFVFVLIYILLCQRKSLKRMILLNERCIQEQASQYKRISRGDRELRRFRHDYNGHVTVLHSLAERDEIQKLKEYISEMAEVPKTFRIISTNNLICDAIVNEYAGLCRSENIIFSVRGQLPERMAITETDFCVLVSNGIRNAYESAQQCRKKREISIELRSRGGFVYIVIMNSAETAPERKGEYLMTSKGDASAHGIGTHNMLETARRNRGEVTWEYNESGFMTTLIQLETEEDF